MRGYLIILQTVLGLDFCFLDAAQNVLPGIILSRVSMCALLLRFAVGLPLLCCILALLLLPPYDE